MRILELFGGIGACSKALERIGIDYEIADYVEIDKYAVKSFNAIHGTNFLPQDICNWNKNIKVDLIMHGSPCQDFSLAGKQAGGDEGSGTRSSLMFETLRIVGKLKPKYVIWENVKNVLSDMHRHNFNKYLEQMCNIGYKNYFQILNAKDYGIPQNRERIFIISIRNDIKKHFIFPPAQELNIKLKDLCDENVEDKYFLSDMATAKLIRHKNKIISTEMPIVSNTVHAGYYKIGDRDQQYIKIKNANKQGYIKATEGDSVNLIYSESKTRRGRVGKEVAQTLDTNCQQGVVVNSKVKYVKKKYNVFFDKNGYIPKMFNPYNEKEIQDVAPTQSTICGSTTTSATVLIANDNCGLKIRKLTPKECWRLMGFDDEDFEKAAKVNSDTQLYKQAGNSIVVNVLEAIFKNLLFDKPLLTTGVYEQLSLFD